MRTNLGNEPLPHYELDAPASSPTGYQVILLLLLLLSDLSEGKGGTKGSKPVQSTSLYKNTHTTDKLHTRQLQQNY